MKVYQEKGDIDFNEAAAFLEAIAPGLMAMGRDMERSERKIGNLNVKRSDTMRLSATVIGQIKEKLDTLVIIFRALEAR